MKSCPKVLIIGEHSYIGSYFRQWMQENHPQYIVNTVSSRNEKWKTENFGSYASIIDAAGIAHVEAKAGEEELYYKINRDLAMELAQKAKTEGTRQFIYLSSMIVYGESNAKNSVIEVNEQTKPNPSGFYGRSKLEAEQKLQELQTEAFNVMIVRPPMVYGKGSKGNYPRLAKLAKKIPVFPDMKNQRSMIYIENLCECLRLMIVNEESGVICPQNKEYVNTANLVKEIAEVSGKKLVTVSIFNPIIKLLAKKINMLNKVFGTMTYTQEMSWYKEDYCIVDFRESIRRTER